MVARAALAVLALAVAGWMATAYPGARAEQQAAVIPLGPDGQLSGADAARARALLADALVRRPDSAAAPRLGGLEVAAGENARAAERMRRLVAAEPANVSAWTVLALALAPTDPDGARAAQERRVALAPAPGR